MAAEFRQPWPIELRGIEVGPGWSYLIQPIFDRALEEGLRVTEVSSQCGPLIIRLDGTPSIELDAMVRSAVRASCRTCETCGTPGRIRPDRGWGARCDRCR